MSFLYKLKLEQDISVDEVADIILEAFPPRKGDRQTARSKMDTTDAWLGSGFMAGVRSTEPDSSYIAHECFGMSPTISVGLIPNGKHLDVLQHEINAVVTAIIHATTGDALYHADFSRHVWLLRRNSVITISDFDETFADEDLAGWILPYTRVEQLMP